MVLISSLRVVDVLVILAQGLYNDLPIENYDSMNQPGDGRASRRAVQRLCCLGSLPESAPIDQILDLQLWLSDFFWKGVPCKNQVRRNKTKKRRNKKQDGGV